MASDIITLAIPADLAETVASALEGRADWFRRDTGHDPEDVAVLQRDADRLDDLAEDIRRQVVRYAAPMVTDDVEAT